MSEPSMSLARLAAILETYGARPERWPDAERPAARALLAASPEARGMQAGALALDGVLDGSDIAAPSAALRAAVLASAPRARARTTSGWAAFWSDLGGWRPASMALAASLLLGIVSGGTILGTPTDAISADIAQLALFGDTFEGFEP